MAVEDIRVRGFGTNHICNLFNKDVEEIADVICAESPDPYVLYGHSMGALISFELARELRRRHSIGPRQLFLSGGRAPTMPREGLTFNLPDDEFIAKLRR